MRGLRLAARPIRVGSTKTWSSEICAPPRTAAAKLELGSHDATATAVRRDHAIADRLLQWFFQPWPEDGEVAAEHEHVRILVNILNPDVLVLGGYFAVLGPWLKEPLEKAIRDRVIAPDGGGCRVVRSELGFTAAVRGGAQISLDQVFVDPTLIGRAEPGIAQ